MTPTSLTAAITTSAETTVLTGQTGHYLHVTSVVVSDVNGDDQILTFKNGNSGSTIFKVAIGYTATVGNTTQNIVFPAPGLRLSAGANLRVASSVASGISLQITAVGYLDRV